MTKLRKGFTLIELLVVIAIIALLATLAVVGLGNARQRARDAKRVADIKQISSALELYFTDQSAYPVEATAVELGDANNDCLDAGGIVAACATAPTYMGLIPTDPGTGTYTYESADGTSYTITFTLEGETGSLPAGARTASPVGIQ